MTMLLLIFEFFKIGLFSVGGGLATLPFLYDIAEKYPWFTQTQLIDMIAISESTPGPIGVNMATFAGYQAAGILGGIMATVAMAIPAIIIISTIAKLLDKFKNNKYVNAAFYGLRPAVAALIFASAFDILKASLMNFDTEVIYEMFNLPAILLMVVLYWAIVKYKKHPIIYLLSAALVALVIPL